jgi:hypothetical protein
MDKDGGPAFPFDYDAPHHMGWEGQTERMTHTGMSLRDWFAGQALAGLLQNEDAISNIQQTAREIGESPPDYTASICWNIADAMLAARNDGDKARGETDDG